MSKQLLPNELAEIVVGLLVKPELLGELDSPESHQSFVRAISEAVADHCGGVIFDVYAPWDGESDGDGYLSDSYSSPLVAVAPDDSLPSLNQCVWSYHDPDGWEREALEDGNDEVPAPSPDEIKQKRMQLQRLLILAAAQ